MIAWRAVVIRGALAALAATAAFGTAFGDSPPASYSSTVISAFGEVYGINNKGQIVGMDEFGRPLLYSNGAVKDLTLWADEVFGINDAGWIIGTSYVVDRRQGVLLRPIGTGEGDLPLEYDVTPLGALRAVHGINNRGQIVGAGEQEGRSVPLLYSNGVVSDLSPWIDTATHINDAGWIAGSASVADRPVSVLLRPAEVGEDGVPVSYDVTVLEGFRDVSGINNKGQIIGVDEEYVPLVYSEGVVTSLLSWTDEVWGINDGGWIVGDQWPYDLPAPQIILLRPLALGIDLASPDPKIPNWSAIRSPHQFVIVQAAGNRTLNPLAEALLREAGQAGFGTAASVSLDFSPNALSGELQANDALLNCGFEVGKLNFMAIAVEHNDRLEYPADEEAVERRIAIIRDAVAAVEQAGVRAVIYTKGTDWDLITGNGEVGSGTREFRQLALWTRQYDGEADLDADFGSPWEPFGGWVVRAGKQYMDDSVGTLFDPLDACVFDASLFVDNP